MHRDVSPLCQAEDAVYLDSSEMTIEEVVDHVVNNACEETYGMKVIVAKTAGFCFGVKRAVDQVYRQIEEEKSRFIRMDRSSTMRRWSGSLRKREYGS